MVGTLTLCPFYDCQTLRPAGPPAPPPPVASPTSPAFCRIAGSDFPSQRQKPWEEIMTNPTDLPDHRTDAGSSGLDRRKLFKGAAALAATAATVKAASAASVAPLGQTGAITPSTAPLPLGPLPGARYPDARLESLKKTGVSFGPTGFPAF